MAGRGYDRWTIEKFGGHLLDTGDLDPVYIALDKMELDFPQLSRWLVAYWSLYHCGAACLLSESSDAMFWGKLYEAAENVVPTPVGGRWPRGHERRHFRGQQGMDAVKSLAARYPEGPHKWLEHLGVNPHGLQAEHTPFATISKVAQEERGFGPWISFKIGDMLDRLDLMNVDFNRAEVFMFKDPREAALRLWRSKTGVSENAMPKDTDSVIEAVVAHLTSFFKDYTAPPLHDRAVGLQEVETILCKWKSHMNGHYPPQNDTIEIRNGLTEWRGVSETAGHMFLSMPEVLS